MYRYFKCDLKKLYEAVSDVVLQSLQLQIALSAAPQEMGTHSTTSACYERILSIEDAMWADESTIQSENDCNDLRT